MVSSLSPLYGISSLHMVLATGMSFFPCLSFAMSRKLMLLSIMVKMAWLSLSTMRSISQSPKRLPSASAGRSWILTRFRILVAFVSFFFRAFRAYLHNSGGGSAAKCQNCVLPFCCSHHAPTFILWRQFLASSPVSSSRMNL